jgi:hypothetical protein
MLTLEKALHGPTASANDPFAKVIQLDPGQAGIHVLFQRGDDDVLFLLDNKKKVNARERTFQLRAVQD